MSFRCNARGNKFHNFLTYICEGVSMLAPIALGAWPGHPALECVSTLQRSPRDQRSLRAVSWDGVPGAGDVYTPRTTLCSYGWSRPTPRCREALFCSVIATNGCVGAG